MTFELDLLHRVCFHNLIAPIPSGPVLNETDTLLVRGTATHQELQWSLHSDSVISVLRVVVTSTEEEENAPFQTFLGPTDYRTIFAGLQEGNTYIYTVIAVGENGGSSVPISITWVAGQSLCKLFCILIILCAPVVVAYTESLCLSQLPRSHTHTCTRPHL